MELCPDLSTSSIEIALRALVQEGLIERHGGGRSTYYVRKDETHKTACFKIGQTLFPRFNLEKRGLRFGKRDAPRTFRRDIWSTKPSPTSVAVPRSVAIMGI